MKSYMLAVVLLFATYAGAAECPAWAVSPAIRDAHGFLVHNVVSPFQSGTTQIRVLLPSPISVAILYPVIYALPVEAGMGVRYGDGMLEIQKHNLQNAYQAIFVMPTFSQTPWYADHPTNPLLQQEMYFLKVIVPFIEQTYPAQRVRQGRLLLGFSKSGWGAWSLLLRHPDVFGRAAAWDSPMMMNWPSLYGSEPFFGTADNFDQYQVQQLVQNEADDLGSQPSRLILTGYGSFRLDHQEMHEILNSLAIPHEYRDGPSRAHNWYSGWVSEAVQILMSKPTAKNEMDVQFLHVREDSAIFASA